jgi:glycosyltransferase involved in cell wall biosynthesis
MISVRGADEAHGRAAETWPPVSIVVPLFNHAEFVTDLLESVQADDYPNLEVVILDDGSTDASRQVVEAWIPSSAIRIQLFSRPNRGLTRTLNELVALARGVYLVPIASDDRLLPGGIRSRVEWLRRNPWSRAVFGDCTVIDERGEMVTSSALVDLFKADKQRLALDTTAEIIRHWSVPGPALMVEREALITIGGYDESLRVEDWDLYLRMAARGWLGFFDEQVAAYRRHTAGASMALGLSLAHAVEMRSVAEGAWHLYRGYYRILLARQIARWRAREALLGGRRSRYLAWGIGARLLAVIGEIIGQLRARNDRRSERSES